MPPTRRRIRNFIQENAVLGKIIEEVPLGTFSGTRSYWEKRYSQGRTSGSGSYGRLAEFKARTLNRLIEELSIQSVIEFGCGDGNQISLIDMPDYIGLDVSTTAIQLCEDQFESDDSKSFFLYDPLAFVDNHQLFQAEMAISMDVLFHLVEEDVYQQYMDDLFSSAMNYVVIYSSNEPYVDVSRHVKHRKFTDWPEQNAKSWSLLKHIENDYPWDPSRPNQTSRSDFYIYEKNNYR